MNRKGGYSALADDDPEYNWPSTSANSERLSENTSLRSQTHGATPKKVYVFGDGTVVDNVTEDTLELTEMSQRLGTQKSYKSTSKSQSHAEDIVVKEIPLVKDDTLHSLSIRFRCPVSINNLHLHVLHYVISISMQRR